MSRFEVDRRGAIMVERRFPASNANAPFVAWFESGKSPFRDRRDEIIAVEHGEIEKLARDFHADGVQAGIFRTGAAKSVPIKSGYRIDTTAFQFRAENIRGHIKLDRPLRA